MITKRKVISLLVAYCVMLSVPIVVVAAGCCKWLSCLVVSLCCLVLVSVSIKFAGVIAGSYAIIANKIHNRLFGFDSQDKVYPLISKEQQSRIYDAIKISFTGDLILLREMVERAYDDTTDSYRFDSMFAHVRDLWKGCDLSIGVFEGPMGGEELGYSTSNYDDGVPLVLNFPDTFAYAIKDAGMGLVSIANNHIFDAGIDAGLRTAKVLDSIGLDYVGLATDEESFDSPKIINVCGKKVGVLAYTFCQNGKSDEFFFGKHPDRHLKPVLPKNSKYFKKNVELIRQDFKRMSEENPDLIIVLPHMGEQFLSAPDKTQLKWCDIFVELGADIIFSDHPHHVQPIEWRRNAVGKNVLIVHCPGNFINSYVDHDGDASMIVSAYLDRNTLEPFAVGVTPIYAHCPQDGMWQGLPTFKALTDENIYHALSRADFRRINHVNRLVTGIALGAPLDVYTAQKEYVSFADAGLARLPPPIEIIDNQNVGKFAKIIGIADSICFVGDSVTDGTKNGGFGWYEPLAAAYPDKNMSKFALGSRTSKWLLENADRISDVGAQLYVVAIGCNDIRYRDPAVCSMSATDFVETLNRFIDAIRKRNANCRFVFIAPWRSLHFDAYFNVTDHTERMRLYDEYTSALSDFCISNNHVFLDPNPLIFQHMQSPTARPFGGGNVLKDFIHPTAYPGTVVYSKAVLSCDEGKQK